MTDETVDKELSKDTKIKIAASLYDFQKAVELLETVATTVAASTNTIVRINNHVAALRSELQDARNSIEQINSRLDENDRIQRECR